MEAADENPVGVPYSGGVGILRYMQNRVVVVRLNISLPHTYYKIPIISREFLIAF